MNIKAFIASLAEVEYTSDTIVADIMSNSENIDNILIPALTTLAGIEADKEVNLKAGSPYTSYVLRGINKAKRTYAATVLEKLPNIKANLDYLATSHNKVFKGKTVNTIGLTAKEGAFIAELSMCHEFIVYTMNLVDVLGRVYAGANAKKTSDIYDVEKYEQAYLNSGLNSYVRVVNHISLKPSNYKKALEAYLDIVINEDNEEYASVGGAAVELDVVNGFVGNPLYHIGKSVAEYQAKRYKSLVAKKRSLELYNMDLEESKSGKNNAVIEKEIVYNRKRIQVLDMDIKKIEED